MTLTLHGIPNCDTVKRARIWLDERGIVYIFHNYKSLGIASATLRHWAEQVGWESLLNRTGTTFRNLPYADRTALDRDKAIALMVAQPSMIKRPVVTGDGLFLVGFKPDHWATVISL